MKTAKINSFQKVLLDITQEFNSFKSGNLCGVCKNVYEDPVILTTCQDIFCKKCLNANLSNCPVCGISFVTNDIEEDAFTQSVLDSIKNIEQIFSGCTSQDEHLNVENDALVDEVLKSVVVCSEMKRNPKGESPLHVACRRGQLEKVHELIQKNVDLNVKDYAGWTPMHEAVQGGHLPCVAALLEEGALPDVPGEGYSTPLHKAAALGHYDIVKLMLKYGAKMNSIDYSGLSPVACAATGEINHLFILEHSEKFVISKYFIHPNTIAHCSIISKQNVDALKKCSSVKIVSSDDYINKNDCTHLVLGEQEEVSMKVLYAILRGIFVVEESWITNYVETEDKTLALKYIPSRNRKTYVAAILNNLKKLPRLFDGMSFHFVDHNKPYKIHDIEFTKKDLIKLVEIGGGKHLHRAPALRTVESNSFYPFHINRHCDLSNCTSYIIYMESQAPQLLYNMKELRHKSSRWLIDCILNFTILTT